MKDKDTDYREMMDKPYLGAWDLSDDEDLILTITKVEEGEVTNDSHKQEKRPLIYFKEVEKPLVCNVTNGEIISNLAGSRSVSKWIGVRIALYPKHNVRVGKQVKDAIRVREYAPKLPEKLVCADCGKTITDHDKYSAKSIAESSRGTYGRALCWECASKAKEAAEAKAKESDVL